MGLDKLFNKKYLFQNEYPEPCTKECVFTLVHESYDLNFAQKYFILG